jgi:hypothetical protein
VEEGKNGQEQLQSMIATFYWESPVLCEPSFASQKDWAGDSDHQDEAEVPNEEALALLSLTGEIRLVLQGEGDEREDNDNDGNHPSSSLYPKVSLEARYGCIGSSGVYREQEPEMAMSGTEICRQLGSDLGFDLDPGTSSPLALGWLTSRALLRLGEQQQHQHERRSSRWYANGSGNDAQVLRIHRVPPAKDATPSPRVAVRLPYPTDKPRGGGAASPRPARAAQLFFDDVPASPLRRWRMDVLSRRLRTCARDAARDGSGVRVPEAPSGGGYLTDEHLRPAIEAWKELLRVHEVLRRQPRPLPQTRALPLAPQRHPASGSPRHSFPNRKKKIKLAGLD